MTTHWRFPRNPTLRLNLLNINIRLQWWIGGNSAFCTCSYDFCLFITKKVKNCNFKVTMKSKLTVFLGNIEVFIINYCVCRNLKMWTPPKPAFSLPPDPFLNKTPIFLDTINSPYKNKPCPLIFSFNILFQLEICPNTEVDCDFQFTGAWFCLVHKNTFSKQKLSWNK